MPRAICRLLQLVATKAGRKPRKVVSGLAAVDCNVILLQYWHPFGPGPSEMTLHYNGGEKHASPSLTPSLLRLSVAQRLAVAGVLIALIWAAALGAVS